MRQLSVMRFYIVGICEQNFGPLVEEASHMSGQLEWIFCKIVVEIIHNPTRKGKKNYHRLNFMFLWMKVDECLVLL